MPPPTTTAIVEATTTTGTCTTHPAICRGRTMMPCNHYHFTHIGIEDGGLIGSSAAHELLLLLIGTVNRVTGTIHSITSTSTTTTSVAGSDHCRHRVCTAHRLTILKATTNTV